MRWAVVPVAFVLIALQPPILALALVLLVGLTIVAGFVEQGVRLGDIPSRARWTHALVGLVGAVTLVVVLGNGLVWLPSSVFSGNVFGNYLVGYRVPLSTYFALSFAPVSGWFIGFFLAGLRSRQVAAPAVAPRVGPDAADRDTSGTGVMGRANKLAALTAIGEREHKLGDDAVTVEGDSGVEVLLDDQWISATLTAWDTRNLGLFAHVRYTHDGDEHDEWVSADLVRRPPGAGPLGAPDPRLAD